MSEMKTQEQRRHKTESAEQSRKKRKSSEETEVSKCLTSAIISTDGMENDEAVPNQLYDLNQLTAANHPCYHLSGLKTYRNYLLSADADDYVRGLGPYEIGHKLFCLILKEFQFNSNLSSVILNDFHIGRITGSNNPFQAMLRRAVYAEERKTFISSVCNHLWLEKLCGITRVAVYGVDSMCVVTWNEDLVRLEKDLARLRDNGYVLDETLPYALISEVEDLAFPPGKSRAKIGERSQKPFGVVSVIAGTNKVQTVNHDVASGDKFDELKTIKFLRDKLNCTSDFTFRKTVKTAVRAFHLLVNKKKFKPNKIRVFVWKSEWEMEDCDCDTIQELKGKDLAFFLS